MADPVNESETIFCHPYPDLFLNLGFPFIFNSSLWEIKGVWSGRWVWVT